MGYNKSEDDYIIELLLVLGEPFERLASQILESKMGKLAFDDIIERVIAAEQSLRRYDETYEQGGIALKAQRSKRRGPSTTKSKAQLEAAEAMAKADGLWCTIHKITNHNDSQCYAQGAKRPLNAQAKTANAEVPDTEGGLAKATTHLAIADMPAELKQLAIDLGAMPATSMSCRGVPNAIACEAYGHTDIGKLRKVPGDREVGMYEWLVDSGASHHMTYDRSNYINFFRGSLRITTANGITFAQGYGDIAVDLIQMNGSIITKTVLGVWYIPDLNCNLLSVHSLAIDKITVYFNHIGKNSFLIQDSKIIGLIDNSDRRYMLKCTKAESIQHRVKAVRANFASAMRTAGQNLSATTWHRRMGHLGFDNLIKLKQCAIGVNFEDKLSSLCKDCVMANMTRRPRKSQTSSLSSEPFELVHMDVWGPSPTPSLGGFHYYLGIVDDFTRSYEVFPMKKKDDVERCFREYQNRVKTLFKKNVKRVRSDGGGEFKFLSKDGLLWEPSTPYSPEQNGVAERLNRTVMAKVRAILVDSGLPHTLWAYFAHMAAYLTNRSPSSALNGMTPYQKLRGVAPDLSHLRIPGCKAYVHIPRNKRNKLDHRAEECRFVGYGASKSIYLVYNTITKRIQSTSDVIFAEGPLGMLKADPGDPDISDLSVESEPDDDDPSHEFPAEGNTSIYRPQQVMNEEELLTTIAEDDDEVGDTITVEPRVPVPREPPASPQPLRRGHRERHPTRRAAEGAAQVMYATLVEAIKHSHNTEPTYQEAMRGPDRERWKEAIQSEMNALVRNGTWEETPRIEGMRILPGKWVLKIKQDGRYKARWVVGGHRQKEGIDYNEVYAAVVKCMSVRVLAALIAIGGLYTAQLDVLNAFLNSTLKELVYMELPTGYERRGYVCRLLRTLYGLRQSPREWYNTIRDLMVKIGFRRTHADHSVFVNHTGVIVIVYVDDMIIAGKDEQGVIYVRKQLSNSFAMTDMGEMSIYLGMEITRTPQGTVTLTQREYTQRVLKEFGFGDGEKQITPMDAKQVLVATTGIPNPERVNWYQRAMGSLLYLATMTRPDIAYTVNKLAQFTLSPTEQHVSAVKRLFRYVRSTSDLGITYSRIGGGLTGFTDANWAGGNVAQDGRRSTSGYIYMLAGGPVSWSAKRQHTVATSSCEAEYIGQCNAAKEAVWLRLLLSEMGHPQDGATPIHADNQSAIALASNPEYHARSKHIDIQYHYVREKVDDQTVTFVYTPTAEMIADGLTKPLEKVKHARFLQLLNLDVVSSSDCLRTVQGLT
jgi:transposase InsO family protein